MRAPRPNAILLQRLANHAVVEFMDESESDELHRRFASVNERYWAEYGKQSRVWRPLPFVPVWFGAGRIGRFWILCNFLLLAVGVALAFIKGSPHDLGLAVIVGALFAFGSGAAQVWAVAEQHQQRICDLSLGETYLYQDLMKLGAELQELAHRLDASGMAAHRHPPAATTDMRRMGSPAT
jgi:hypothetical protein